MRSQLVLVMSMLMLLSVSCSYVRPGHVGVKVYLLGGDKGVDEEVLPVGRYWLGVNEDLYVYPTFTQNYVWTKDPAESSPDDESITFQTVEGMDVGADVGISYKIRPDHVAQIFQKYRRGIEEITDVYLRNMVRDAFIIEAGTDSIGYVYGAGKADLIKRVHDRVRNQVDTIGIDVEKIYYVSSLRLPPKVKEALDDKVKATQEAQKRELQIQDTIAEAKKKVEAARGDSIAMMVVASAEVQRMRLQGEMLAKYPDIVRLNAVDRWNGILPHYNGSPVVPFLSIGDK